MMSAFKKLTICPFSKFMAMLGHGVTQHTLIDCKPSTDISKIQPTTWGDGCLADAGFERGYQESDILLSRPCPSLSTMQGP